mmetsp:Transcript_26245/g.67791  ORF Transcript_26245/g.67791 Transcript_26245/m.67791 type:complete len:624 (-) Transcript_26245:96-1967(-)
MWRLAPDVIDLQAEIAAANLARRNLKTPSEEQVLASALSLGAKASGAAEAKTYRASSPRRDSQKYLRRNNENLEATQKDPSFPDVAKIQASRVAGARLASEVYTTKERISKTRLEVEEYHACLQKAQGRAADVQRRASAAEALLTKARDKLAALRGQAVSLVARRRDLQVQEGNACRYARMCRRECDELQAQLESHRMVSERKILLAQQALRKQVVQAQRELADRRRDADRAERDLADMEDQRPQLQHQLQMLRSRLGQVECSLRNDRSTSGTPRWDLRPRKTADEDQESENVTAMLYARLDQVSEAVEQAKSELKKLPLPEPQAKCGQCQALQQLVSAHEEAVGRSEEEARSLRVEVKQLEAEKKGLGRRPSDAVRVGQERELQLLREQCARAQSMLSEHRVSLMSLHLNLREAKVKAQPQHIQLNVNQPKVDVAPWTRVSEARGRAFEELTKIRSELDHQCSVARADATTQKDELDSLENEEVLGRRELQHLQEAKDQQAAFVEHDEARHRELAVLREAAERHVHTLVGQLHGLKQKLGVSKLVHVALCSSPKHVGAQSMAQGLDVPPQQPEKDEGKLARIEAEIRDLESANDRVRFDMKKLTSELDIRLNQLKVLERTQA